MAGNDCRAKYNHLDFSAAVASNKGREWELTSKIIRHSSVTFLAWLTLLSPQRFSRALLRTPDKTATRLAAHLGRSPEVFCMSATLSRPPRFWMDACS